MRPSTLLGLVLAVPLAAVVSLPVLAPPAGSLSAGVAPAVTRPQVRRPRAARYLPPVDAPVRDPFRPPVCAWCAGNRGLEYDTDPGQTVVASAPGIVTFAGPVARTLWVVVSHRDGLRTSYGLLDAITVTVGQQVAAGEPVGVAGDAVNFGVRRGDVYLNPAALLAGGGPVPRLVPVDGGPPRWPRAG